MESPLEPLGDMQPPHVWMPRRSLWLIGIVVVLLVVAVAWWGLSASRREAAPVAARDGKLTAPAVSVSVQTVVSTTSPQGLDVTGTVRPELESPIASKVMGRVRSVLAREGDTVRRGQTLIVLDARDLDASIAQADANLRSSSVGYDSARVAARMETSLSAARISEARARVTQGEAALQAANARLDLVQAGPRQQEREQAALAVAQAKSTLDLAASNMNRMSELYRSGAISAQQHEQYTAQYEVAKAQYDTAQQGRSIADEGSRVEDIRAAKQAVLQAQASLQEAHAGLKSAQASALQMEVRRQQIQGAAAQIGQSQAGLNMAKVTRSYAVIAAPFDGIVTQRMADPGAMASPGVPLLMVQGGALRLEAMVPESVLTSVRKGARIPVQFDALGNRTLSGRVVEIAPRGDAGSHTFIVKINLPPRSGASAGMFGRARLTTGSEKRLLVPTSAVFEREGLNYLYVVDDGNVARLRMVTIGDHLGQRVSILSGLNPGERVVDTGRERVVDGTQVAEGSR